MSVKRFTITLMEKQTAINLLGGTPSKAAKVLGYKSVQAVYLWPEKLPQSLTDRVNGAISRIAKQKRKQTVQQA